METANGPFLKSAATANRVRLKERTTLIAWFWLFGVSKQPIHALRAIGTAELVSIAISE